MSKSELLLMALVRSVRNSFRLGPIFLLMVGLNACTPESDEPSPGTPDPNQGWLIPLEQIVDGGVGKDGIFSLENPRFVSANEAAAYMEEDDLVLGVLTSQGPKAYPHKILDWHEIINDEIDGEPFAIIYCPLTGTGTAWGRQIQDTITTFGISGLLFQNNVIPYDRLTDSNWSQMRNQCVKGKLVGRRPQTHPLLETTWEHWKALYPETQVVSNETGFNINYNFYPYFDYKENHLKLPFPLDIDDSRLPRKERVLGVVISDTGPKTGARAYPFRIFGDSVRVINDLVKSSSLVVVGSESRNFAVAYDRRLNGVTLEFEAIQDGGQIVMRDEEGNEWDIFGKALSGPRQGEQLTPLQAYPGFWFAWGAFHEGIEIFEP